MNNLFFIRFVHFCFRFWLALVLQVVGGDVATSSIHFGVEEPVVVQWPKNSYHVSFLKLELFVACVYVRACQRRVVVVARHIHFSCAARLLCLTPRQSFSALSLNSLHFLASFRLGRVSLLLALANPTWSLKLRFRLAGRDLLRVL